MCSSGIILAWIGFRAVHKHVLDVLWPGSFWNSWRVMGKDDIFGNLCLAHLFNFFFS